MSDTRYENLPVYKKALDLARHFEAVVRGFDKYHKYTVGSELRLLAGKILILVAKANIKENRKICLSEAIEKLEEMKILVRLCKEIEAFRSFKSFEFASKSVIEVAKQCEGWMRSQNS